MKSRIRRLIISSIRFYSTQTDRHDRDLFAGMERNYKKYIWGHANPDYNFTAAECAQAAEIVLYLYNWRSAWFAKLIREFKRVEKNKRRAIAYNER